MKHCVICGKDITRCVENICLGCSSAPSQTTLRDRFAMAAAAGFMARTGSTPAMVAEIAYRVADAMLAERVKATIKKETRDAETV